MNQTQRNFLIKKIEEIAKTKTETLKNSIPNPPSLNNYLLHAVLSNNFEIRSTEEIKEIIRKYALKSTDREDWMGNSWGGANKLDIHFKAQDFFIVPEEWQKLYDEYRQKRTKVEQEIITIRQEVEALITRIQLASDKTLQTMINEVDDMGNISLMDTKLKMLTA